jgi:hypothetical protein
MQQVLIVHLLKNGFGLQVCGHVEEHLEWQVASQSELGVPLREPSSHWFCQLFIQDLLGVIDSLLLLDLCGHLHI